MIRKINIQNDTPVTIYDCNKQSVIGIFSTKILVAKYLFNDHISKFKTRVRDCISRKSRINDSVLNIPIALRYANEKQIELLGGKDYLINDGYYIPRETLMKGFTETAKTLHDNHCGKYRVPPSKQSNQLL